MLKRSLLVTRKVYRNKLSRHKKGNLKYLTLKKKSQSHFQILRFFSTDKKGFMPLEDNPITENVNNQPLLERQLTSTFDRMPVDDGSGEDLDEAIGATRVASASNILEIIGSYRDTSSQEVETQQEKFVFKVGEATDIGGGHENQDKSMCFRAGKQDEHLILAVFDGHGRELGELAAKVARDFMKQELSKPEVLKELSARPEEIINALFEVAHDRIKQEFRQKVEENSDCTVNETPEGYLIKRQRVRGQGRGEYDQIFETNVHGGTTATLVVILNSRRLIVANVGDSTALFGGRDSSGKVSFKELSAEHSPESSTEFTRVKACDHVASVQKDESNSLDFARETKSLRFVYDVIDETSRMTPKYSCPSIFDLEHSTTNPRKLEGGQYYKNVRCEWATLVTTPPTARFQDALAFTRSLGDLHLHVYGVSHTPEICEFDLTELHNSVTSSDSPSLLLVCTDGVWDNWKYEDIVQRVFDSNLLQETVRSTNAQPLTDEMMAENLRLARRYFGNQADNMTGVLCLIHSPSIS